MRTTYAITSPSSTITPATPPITTPVGVLCEAGAGATLGALEPAGSCATEGDEIGVVARTSGDDKGGDETGGTVTTGIGTDTGFVVTGVTAGDRSGDDTALDGLSGGSVAA